ncbi:hypothetical protein MMC25_005206 [Agyrium rufum]|nr:hypothetical protein [Agyrium rufum]
MASSPRIDGDHKHVINDHDFQDPMVALIGSMEVPEAAIDLESQDPTAVLLGSTEATEAVAEVEALDDVTTATVLTTLTAKHLTLFSACAILVGGQIGSGIFSSPSQVDKNVPSPGAALLVWMLGGVLAWTGAAAFAELGACIPVNGGMQEYLGYIYGDFLASVMSWIWIVAVKPSSMAILSIIFAEYWMSIVSAEIKSAWLTKALALGTLGALLLVNSVSLSFSTQLTRLLFYSKLFTVWLLVFLAFLVLASNLNGDGKGVSQDWRTKSWFTPSSGENSSDSGPDWDTMSSWDMLGHYTTTLYAGLWAYGG